jgi:predicted nucleotidyltransferase
VADENDFAELIETMKKSAAALRDAGVPFVLAGGLAAWARGGPASEHDVDFLVKPSDAERALQVLVDAGLRPERPPEDWLLKAYDGDVLVDLIFEPSGGTVTDEVIERAEETEVMAMRVRVASVEEVLVMKLLALSEQALDYGSVLEIARALREQIDWEDVRERTAESPFAQGFFAIAEGLEIVPPAPVQK